jgi:hypothetical protein
VSDTDRTSVLRSVIPAKKVVGSTNELDLFRTFVANSVSELEQFLVENLRKKIASA